MLNELCSDFVAVEDPPLWTQQLAIDLCVAIEAIAPDFGCHVALTGGSLYKSGERKDVDVLFYRIRQVDKIDREGLLKALRKRLGLLPVSSHGWVEKVSTPLGHNVDLFFPDHIDRQGEGGYNV